jgi:SAM-dependent methyltransferase
VADPPETDLLREARTVVEAGRFNDALPLLRRAANAQPDNAEIYCLAGQCLLKLRDFEAALDAFHRAIQAQSDWPEPYLGAAEALASRGDAYGSMQALLQVLEFAPEEVRATQQLVELLVRIHPAEHLPALEPALVHCFSQPDVDPTPLTRLCGQQLQLSIDDMAQDGPLPDELVDQIAGGRLWHAYLSCVINTDPALEGFLVRLRRHFCLSASLTEADDAQVKLVAALAQQCFMNEYVWPAAADEIDRLQDFELTLETDKEEGAAALVFALACMYRAPEPGPTTQALVREKFSDFGWLEDLVRLTVWEPLEEQQLAAGLSTLHEVRDESSLAVQAQYEANPYPRWRASPVPAETELVKSIYSRFSQRADAVQDLPSSPRLLVAGCGTGFEPIDIARRDNSMSITALDLSRASLAYARRKAGELGCENIEFMHGDILDLPRLGKKFDVIVCTGVLHHMADPLAGWQILREQLAVGGMMRIGLYSARARQAVGEARERIEEWGFSPSPDDIRECRQRLMHESQEPELRELRWSDDFYSLSGCRDLLFHALEHQFTLPQLGSALASLGLRFCGFDPDDPTLLRKFSVEYPGDERLLDLDAWDRFERVNPGIFSGMYNFWCEPV